MTEPDPSEVAQQRGRPVASRMRRFLQALVSSYLSMAAAGVYTIVSVPLALHYLSRAEFGLWALMTQIGGYLTLVDLGMSSSTARFLIEHKDHPERGEYGSVVLTGQLVLFVQGFIIVLAGCALSPLLARLLDIPSELRHSFVMLMCWQSAILGATMATKVLNHLLFAHQRIDVMNYWQPLGFALMTAVLWIALRNGASVFSVIWVNAAGWLVSTVVQALACVKLGFFPPRGAWGRPDVARFKELFGLGKDLFLISLGEQLISASQTILISRGLGLELVAIWSVGTKAFYMVSLVIRRIVDLSFPPLAEMFVRKEHTQLRERFRAVTTVSASIGGLAAMLIVACNTPFVTIWTHGKITWTAGKDALLGAWLIVLCVRHCHINLVSVTKDIRFMRFIFLIEGVVFVVLAGLVERWWGLAGIIGCSIACNTCISGAYTLRRSSETFGISIGEVSWNWLKPAGKELLPLVLLAVAVYVPTRHLTEWARLLVRGTLLGSLGTCLLLRYGLPIELKRELVQRLPQFAGVWVRRVANV